MKLLGDVCRGEAFRSEGGLSQRVSLEVSSDACTGGNSRYYSANIDSYFKLGGGFADFADSLPGGGGCHTGSRWRCRVVCVGVKGSQIQDRAVTQGVVRGVSL